MTALAHGLTAHSRSPASQNTMPRTREESATASSTVTSAPQALASTTPVSSRRGVPPLRASRWTTTTAITRARHRGTLHRQHGGARDHGEQRADRRAAGHAEHVGVGERVAEQRLQQHAGQREEAPDPERRQHPRQPHRERHAAGHAVAGTQQCRQDPRRRQLGAADEQRADEHRGGEQQQARRGPFQAPLPALMQCGDRLQVTPPLAGKTS